MKLQQQRPNEQQTATSSNGNGCGLRWNLNPPRPCSLPRLLLVGSRSPQRHKREFLHVQPRKLAPPAAEIDAPFWVDVAALMRPLMPPQMPPRGQRAARATSWATDGRSVNPQGARFFLLLV